MDYREVNGLFSIQFSLRRKKEWQGNFP